METTVTHTITYDKRINRFTLVFDKGNQTIEERYYPNELHSYADRIVATINRMADSGGPKKITLQWTKVE